MLWQSAMQTELMFENQKQAMGCAPRMRAILKQHMITQMNAKIQQAQILQRVEYMSNCNVNLIWYSSKWLSGKKLSTAKHSSLRYAVHQWTRKLTPITQLAKITIWENQLAIDLLKTNSRYCAEISAVFPRMTNTRPQSSAKRRTHVFIKLREAALCRVCWGINILQWREENDHYKMR